MERRRAQQQAEPATRSARHGADKRAMRTPEQIEAMQAERARCSPSSRSRRSCARSTASGSSKKSWSTSGSTTSTCSPARDATRVYLTEYERDAIRPHVLGKFRDLLGATAKSPAMLFYLDNWQSADPDGADAAAPMRDAPSDRSAARRPPCATPADAGSRRRRTSAPAGLNENYARELMELHTLGVDGGYTQQDVIEVARAFTGWTIADAAAGRRLPLRAAACTTTARRWCSATRIKAGGGEHDGEQVLDILARASVDGALHRHQAGAAVRRRRPPAALVDRAAARFRETDGDIREVVRTIVTSPEFFAAERVSREGEDAVRVRRQRACARPAPTSATRCRSCRRCASSACRSTCAQPPTGYADRADAWVNTGALAQPHELRASR